ncbi:alpha/beta hydrolase [Chitinimonas prasina]|uniref:Alpha/beta hydrolase n=1 Tax=Chitinimonas prasina TaxID=1434937 RepID=A0ABQ5YJQ5_9NEIS|nr:alpha/beta hydrolase [Chitinimonas prasina]GLR14752.1 alpha/beta hydrolase [Chitinimonas prasina]
MSAPRLAHVLVGRETGVYRMAYREWGDAANPRVVVCAHGLTRNGRDFESLAHALAGDFRVVAPDVVGRGESDWLRDPMGYQVPLYVQDMLVLIARLNVATVHWVGTSMGGLIGMILAAMPGTPIRRLLLNDVGPVLAASALARIGEYVGKAPAMPSRAAAEAYIRAVSAPFGPHSDAQWAFLTEVMLKPDGNGWRLNYDPGIAIPFQKAAGDDVNLWPLYDNIRCPVLLTRGAQSDLLSVDTACAMSERGPKAAWVDFEGVGHAPTFLQEDQIAVARSFLKAE